MARSDQGNNLASELLQPGWSAMYDGYGLVTSTCTFKCNWATSPDSFASRGAMHPDASYSFCTAQKWTVSYDALGIATYRVDYVGIDPDTNDGSVTEPNCSGANGLTSENITAHPNFFTVQTGYLGAIAGASPYTQDSPDNLAPVVNGAPAYLGLNGSCFEQEKGGRFIGFVDPSYAQYYGKTQYLARTTSYSGIIYADESAAVEVLIGLIGTSNTTRDWSTFTLLPIWAPIGTGMYSNPVNLLSQVNVEEYGSIYKVMYEIRYSTVGWELDVYKKHA